MNYHHHHHHQQQQQQLDRELPNEIERLVLDDEHLRKSLIFDDRPPSISSNYEQKKHKKRQKYHDSDYQIVNGFFEDRHGQRRPVKLDRTRTKSVKDYQHLHNDLVNSAPGSSYDRYHRHQAKSLIQFPDSDQKHSYPAANFPLPNQQLMRPYGTAFLPRGAPFYPQTPFSSTPLFSQPNFMNRPPMSRPPFWYRPM